MQFMSTMTPALTICVNIGMVIVIWAGGLQAIRGGLTIGQIVAFTNYLLTTMTPLIMMTMLSNTWANGMASARRVNEVLDTVPDVQDVAGRAAAARRSAPAVVDFQDVSFHYHGGSDKRTCWKTSTCVAEPGQTWPSWARPAPASRRWST